MRRMLEISILLPLIILASFALGIWGWGLRADEFGLSTSDIVMRALGSMVVATAYESGDPTTANWQLNAARLLGASAFVLAASQAIARLLSRNASLWFGRFRRNHLLIVGDHAIARGLVEQGTERGRDVTWITNSDSVPSPVPGALIVAQTWDKRLPADHAAQHAAHCVIAFTDEVSQIAAVRDIRRLAPRLPMTMNFEDPWFGERMDELENISGVRYVSLTDLALRSLHWQHPPFLIAQRLGQERLHVLLIGFGRTGEAVLDDMLLCSLTSFQGKPRVTIVDPNIEEIEASLRQRCPDLTKSVDIELVRDSHTLDARVLPWDRIKAAHAEVPITIAYICLNTDNRALTVAVSLQALVRREGWAIGPICTRLSASGAIPERVDSWTGDQPAGLLAFGATYDFAGAIGLFDPEMDLLPRLVHETYRRVAPDHSVANLPWERLTEEMRESNRRLIIHLPAKLASAGVDITGWLGRGMTAPKEAIPDLAGNPELLEQLAALEHARWMAERRISGWQYGAKRDTLRHHHPDLVPWAELPEASKRYDRAIVLGTLEAVSHLRDR
ncbi:MAG: RyR domain-containing protein [Sandaracinobacteroides sp.]